MLLLVSEHYADDLEVDLEAAMMQDFHCELQDDSPRQVSSTLPSRLDTLVTLRLIQSLQFGTLFHAGCSNCCLCQRSSRSVQTFNPSLLEQVSITLVSLHQECLQGNFSRMQQLRDNISTGGQNLAQSQQEMVSADSRLHCDAALHCHGALVVQLRSLDSVWTVIA